MLSARRSSIQLVLENSSTVTVSYMKLAFSDMHMTAALAELRREDLPAGEAYELDLSMREAPVLSWHPPNEPLVIGPGARAVISVQCFGKLGWCAHAKEAQVGRPC